MILLFLKFYGQFIGLITLCYLAGGILRHRFSPQHEHDITRFFLNSVTGITFFIFCYSVYTTGFKTVNLFFLIPVLYLFTLQKEVYVGSRKLILRLKKTTLYELLLFSLFAFTWLFSIHTKFFSGFSVPFCDYIFYTSIAEYLNLFGRENTFLDYIYASRTGVSPYHYFEIWINAMANRANGELSIYNLFFLVYPYCLFLVIAGIRNLISNSSIRFISVVTGCLLLLTLSSVFLSFYEEIEVLKGLQVFCISILTYKKTLPIYIFLLVAFYFLKTNKTNEIITVLLCLPMVSIAFAPCAIPTAIIIILFSKNVNKPFALVAVITLFVLLLVFYSRNSSVNQVSQTPGVVQLIHDFAKKENLITAFNIVIKSCFQVFVLYVPYLVLLLLGLRQKPLFGKHYFIHYKHYFIFIPSIFFFSLTGWAVLNKTFNSIEIFSNAAIPLLNITVIFMYATFFFNPLFRVNNTVKICAILTGLFPAKYALSNIAKVYAEPVYSQDYIENVASIKNILNPVGVYVYGDGDYRTIFDKTPNFTIPARFLKILKPNTFTISLSVLRTPRSSDPDLYNTENLLMRNTSFYKYVTELKAKKMFLSEDYAIHRFIIENKINYIVLGKYGTLPVSLKSMVIWSDKDSVSGETFILLNDHP